MHSGPRRNDAAERQSPEVIRPPAYSDPAGSRSSTPHRRLFSDVASGTDSATLFDQVLSSIAVRDLDANVLTGQQTVNSFLGRGQPETRLRTQQTVQQHFVERRAPPREDDL